jgi:hypothetical protein
MDGTTVLYISVSALALAIIILGLVIWYGRRDPSKQPENIEMLQNADKMEQEGKLSHEDAEVIRKSVEG